MKKIGLFLVTAALVGIFALGTLYAGGPVKFDAKAKSESLNSFHPGEDPQEMKVKYDTETGELDCKAKIRIASPERFAGKYEVKCNGAPIFVELTNFFKAEGVPLVVKRDGTKTEFTDGEIDVFPGSGIMRIKWITDTSVNAPRAIKGDLKGVKFK